MNTNRIIMHGRNMYLYHEVKVMHDWLTANVTGYDTTAINSRTITSINRNYTGGLKQFCKDNGISDTI